MLNYEFPPMGGGAGNATYNIARELVEMGHKVDVLTSKLNKQKNEEVIDGVRVYRVFSWRNSIHDCGFKGAYTYLFFAIFVLRKLCRINKYDLFHYFFSLPTGLLTLIPGKHKKMPYIVSLRGSDVPYYDIHNKKVHLLNKLLIPINTNIWKKAKKIVALSNGLKETALRSAPNQRFDVIPNGINTTIFKPTTNKKDNKPVLNLITVSRLINRKGINHILEALAELQNKHIKLLIVGTGNYENILKKKCSELGLDDAVSFYGYCPREKLADLYNKADVFILPSLAESFGMVFVEAMACELPIIGGRTGGVPELIKNENGILIEPGNIEEIKEAIMKMWDSDTLRLKMGKDNRKKVLEHYSWKSVAGKYLKLYEKQDLNCANYN